MENPPELKYDSIKLSSEQRDKVEEAILRSFGASDDTSKADYVYQAIKNYFPSRTDVLVVSCDKGYSCSGTLRIVVYEERGYYFVIYSAC